TRVQTCALPIYVDDQRVECRDDRGECRADDERDGQLDQVATHQELFEALHGRSPLRTAVAGWGRVAATARKGTTKERAVERFARPRRGTASGAAQPQA